MMNPYRELFTGMDVRVPLLDGSKKPYISLDNAASTPALKCVQQAVNEFLEYYSSVHRGTGFKSLLSTHIYEQSRDKVMSFVGANPDDHICIFGKNSTEASNKLARRFVFTQGRDTVLLSTMEHHSNDLPWRAVARIEHVEVDADGALDEAHLDALLDRYRGRVRLVAVAGASNVTGYINPVHRLAEKTHAAGAEILVDAAQLAPHRAIDMRDESDPGCIDYLVCSAHKMYAPYGTGALIGRRQTFLQGDPDLVGGGTVDIVTLDDVRWAGLPDKEEAGSPNVVGAVAMAKAMLCLQEIGMAALVQHEAQLTAHLLERLSRIDKVRVYGITDPARAAEKVGVVPLTIEGMSHYLVAAILSAEGGIGVRNGCFCAHPYLLRLLGVPAEEARLHQQEIQGRRRQHLPGLVRASFGCYNTEEEVDWLADMLERIARGEYEGKYVQDPVSGAFWPQGYEIAAAPQFRLR